MKTWRISKIKLSILKLREHYKRFQIRHDHHQQPSSGSESLTDFKLKTLSSRDGVEKSFQQYVEETSKEKGSLSCKIIHSQQFDVDAILFQTDKLVVQHVRRFRIDAKCQWPSRKVIDAPSTAYTPRRYVVFKCSDDTACCNSHEETCAAKNSKQVDLWFRVGKVNYEEDTIRVNKSEFFRY